MKRSGSAVWSGDLTSGKGKVGSESGALDNIDYSFAKRFEDEAGTNPEELIAAAHASCFSMALSKQLSDDGITAESISTSAVVTLDFVDGAPTITRSDLTTVVRIPGADAAAFNKAAEAAKAGCPVSRLLNAEISLDATLEN